MGSDPLSPALARRLAAYSASVGVALAAASTADAQVVYTDIDPDVVLTSGHYYLDFNDDGIDDLRFSVFGDRLWAFAPAPVGNGGNRSLAFVGWKFERRITIYNEPDPLGLSHAVGVENARFADAYVFCFHNCQASLLLATYYAGGFLPGPNDKHLGLGIAFDGDPAHLHTAWVRVQVPEEGTIIIKDYAYDAIPRSHLRTGQTERFVIADGDIDRNVFPASGGALTYTAAFTNATDADLTLDLRAVASRGTIPGFDQDLGTLTVPAGTTVTRDLVAEVPAGAPPGFHYVSFKATAPGGPAYGASQWFQIKVTEAHTALIAGEIDRDTLPAEGGTITFTGTVTNGAPEPVDYDLWATLRQDGVNLIQVYLGSGSLPVGGSEPVTAELDVPAGAPAGTYGLYYRVGVFESNVVYDQVAFVVTKATPTAMAPEVPPGGYALSAVAPNPTEGTASVVLSVAVPQAVRVTIHDALGREVAVLHDGALAAGAAHRLVFDGSSLPAGVYAVRAVGETFTDVRTLTLIR